MITSGFTDVNLAIHDNFRALACEGENTCQSKRCHRGQQWRGEISRSVKIEAGKYRPDHLAEPK